MSTVAHARPGVVEQRIRCGELYVQAEEFYVRQLELRVAGDVEGWTRTFTPDAVLESAAPGEPARGHAALAALACGASPRAGADAPAPRYSIGKLEVHPRDDGALRTWCSTIVRLAPAGGGPAGLHVCVVEDVLVRSLAGTWRTGHRRVVRDVVL
ncbi:nuclear transport factor 2 family protein [Streptomyces sp. NPDC047315]|uniref:nuclear transport factor 2 family protein n=1 Tax=Streptomyces sp. NPDC047315 TaxID=3155142 RepID=UPI0033F4795F